MYYLTISVLLVQIISVRSQLLQVESVTYNVSIPSRCSAHSESCFDLSEVATSVNTANRSVSNISLILMPGNHSLLSNVLVVGRTHFLMKSKDSQQPAVINCGVSSRLQIHYSAYVHIQGIILNGCVENEVRVVKSLTIENTTLTATGMTNNVSGRALVISNSAVAIVGSTFKYFTRPMILQLSGQGGAILSLQSDILISNSMFFMNQAGKGGVMYCAGSTVLINNSIFSNSSAIQGGVLYIKQNGYSALTSSSSGPFQDHAEQWKFNSTMLSRGSVFCSDSNFTMNQASREGGVLYGEVKNSSYKIFLYMYGNSFIHNNANNGVVFETEYSSVVIHQSNFQYNRADEIGGVGYCHHSVLLIYGSIFCHNQAGLYAGTLFFVNFTSAVITSGTFYRNMAGKIAGCLAVHRKSYIIFTGMIFFEHNVVERNAIIHVYDSNITCNGSLLHITKNSGSIILVHSTGHFAGYTLLKDNEGTIHFYDSKVVISGNLISVKQNNYHHTWEGGCITLFLSTMMISGGVILNDSIATNGGGMLSISSRVVVDVSGELMVMNNTASDTGGGIYVYHSELRVHGLVLVDSNKANTFGGGIHCITSTIILIHNHYSRYLKLTNNKAVYGGAICLEANSKFYIKHLSGASKEIVIYAKNTANYGGAIYVVDNTTTGTCASSKVRTVTTSLQSECFFQILMPIIGATSYPRIKNYFLFAQNRANMSGANLYGGLLDRCTVYSSGRNIQYSTISTSVLTNVASEPVRLCFCTSEYNSTTVNCTHSPPTMHVIKGSNFTLQLAAVDQVNHEVSAVIYGSLKSRQGYLGEGQLKQLMEAACKDLNFSIMSPVQNYDCLVLHADGPCKDLGISALKIRIEFDDCHCPIGFEPEPETRDKCICRCHRVLKNIFPYLECNSNTLLIIRNHDYWLSTIKKGTKQYLLTYKQCPSYYCYSSTTTVFINLNISHGSDVQCAFNHTGVLCGRCQPSLTLSLGSSRCIECPQFWPASTVAILVGAFLAGFALVALILVLNLTVASGTLNGVIFYANIITIDQQLFMPFERPNFHSVFIAWLSLDMGFDVCFFKGLSAYAKAWLQLTFPLYIIFIVVAVIVASHCSKKFANLVSRKNPVATLATLILLSYTKLLHNIIEILSYAILQYTAEDESDSLTKVVWLHDGSIAYLKGTHIPLFIVAVLIVIAGFIYTLLLLTWQWLVKFSNKVPFLWVRNTRLSSFMDAYHAPYTARNHYWTGLLLLARVILYLIAAINVSGEPSVNLLAILLVIGCVSLLHAYSGISIYKKWPLNVVECTTIFNILAFTAVKFYIQVVGGNHAAIAYTSISIQFALFVFSLLYHIVLEFHILDKAKKTICRYKSQFSQNLSVPLLLDSDVQHTAPSHDQKVTYSEVTIKKPEIQLTSGVDSEREELPLLLSSTDNSQV